MNYQQANIPRTVSFFLIILFLGLMSVSITHAETYTFVTKWGSEKSDDGKFGTQSVAVDSLGNIYCLDSVNDRILKLDSNGTFVTKWGSEGYGDGQFSYPNGVTVDSSGNVYVSEGTRIQKFDSNGTFITKWGSYGSDDGQFHYASSVAVDSSGNVYVSDSNYSIQKFDSNGTFITKWGSYGSGDGQFSNQHGVAVDSSGNVYVADYYNQRIQKFDSNGTFITKWGSSGSGDGQFSYPLGVAVDSSSNVYVADTFNDRVQKFDSNGTFITKWGSSGSGDGQFISTNGVAVDFSGNVYVIDQYNARIQKFIVMNDSEVFLPCKADFYSDRTRGFAPLSVEFKDCSLNATRLNWDFGDGANSTDQHPIHTYNTAGTYTVNLTVSNPNSTDSKLSNIQCLALAELYNLVTEWGSAGSGDGQFDSPSDVAIDSSGNVYVADSKNDRIQKFDSNGTFITKWGTDGNGDEQFFSPTSIAVDSLGNVYVTDGDNNSIQKFDSNGIFITKWGSSGSGDGQFFTPEGVAVDSSGNVYVADKWNYRIQKFDSNGIFITKWGSSGSGDRQLYKPSDIAVDSSDNIYIIDAGYGFKKFDSNGTFITEWGSFGEDDDQFFYPTNIDLDSSGNIYIGDLQKGHILKFDGNGNIITKLDSAAGFAVDSPGNIYVADSGNNRIQKFAKNNVVTPILPVANFSNNVSEGYVPLSVQFTDNSLNADGWNWNFGDGANSTEQSPMHTYSKAGTYTVNLTVSNANSRDSKSATITVLEQPVTRSETYNFITQWGSSGNGNGQFIEPRGVAVDSAGNVYVADRFNNYIQKFDSDGNFITQWGSFGSGNGQFNAPWDVAVDSLGNIYVADSGTDQSYAGNDRIQKFDSSGTFIKQWGSAGSGDGQFNEPHGVAVDSSGNVYVVDYDNNRIQKFDSDGNFITKWGSFGSEDGQFFYPYGIAVDSSGNVYVADWGNARIQKFNSNGAFISKWGQQGTGDGQFDYPYGITVDSSGNVFVSDMYNYRIEKFDSNGSFITQWGSYGDGGGQFSSPSGIAVDSSGNVYVADTWNSCIQKFAINGKTHPLAKFTSNITKGYAPLSVQFNDTSTGTPTKWNWDFGDGNTSTQQNPVNLYSSAGNYSINLTVSNDNGTSSKLANIKVPRSKALNITDSGNNIYYAYITNSGSNNVSVIDTNTNSVIASINVGSAPEGVAVNPDGQKVYVANYNSNNISVIDTTTNSVTATVDVGLNPYGVAVNPTGTKVYVANSGSNTVSVIDTATNSVTATVDVGIKPEGIAVTPDGTKVYVANNGEENVSVIDTATNKVTTTVNLGFNPVAIAVNPKDPQVYVTEDHDGHCNVFVIDTRTNGVVASVLVSYSPLAIAVSPDGTKVYAINSFDNGVYVIDTVSTAVVDQIEIPDGLGVSITPDGKELYVADSEGISVIDPATNTVKTKVPVGEGPVAFGQFISSSTPHAPILPAANFSSNITEGYALLSVQFTDLSENATGWNWDFGDGNNSTEQNPAYTYSTTGNYLVNLTVSNANGKDSKSATINVSEKSVLVLPDANLSTNVTIGFAPLSVQFNDSSVNTDTVSWDFGDGNVSTDRNPLHTYFTVGNYTVNLTAINNNGTDSKSITISVLQRPPESLNNVATEESSQETVLSGIPASFDFSNGSTPILGLSFSTGQTLGDTLVTIDLLNGLSNLTSGSPSGNVYQYLDIWINNATSAAPEDFSNATISFKVNKTWVQNNNINISSIILNRYNNGVWTVLPTTLTGEDDSYLYFTAITPGFSPFAVSGSVAVLPVYPVANFIANITEGYAPLDVQFTSLSTDATYLQWNFGDGSSNVSDANPEHVFASSGLFNVVLTASNGNGSNSKSMTINVTQKPVRPINPTLPTAFIGTNSTGGTAPLTVQFSDLSTDETSGRVWNFGDGTSSTDQNPIHIYTTPNRYTVTLTAYNGNGSILTSKTITVTQPPVLKINDFNSDVTSGYEPLTSHFTSVVRGKPTVWTWTFGKSVSRSFKNYGAAAYTFKSAGAYDVTLTVKDAAGHTDTLTKKTYITVLKVKPPKANFVGTPFIGKAPLTVQFTDMSTNNPAQWAWNFGDGKSSTLRNPSHTYTKIGKYTVSLSVKNNAGKDTKTVKNYIVVSQKK